MKKIELFGLIIGLSAVISATLILIFNQGFHVGIKSFVPENNPLIRYIEIIFGLTAIPVLLKIIREKIR